MFIAKARHTSLVFPVIALFSCNFYARSNVIFRKFHHCSASIKVNLIKTYCAPYCSQVV